MNIVYDGAMLRWQKAGGIRKYFTEVIAGLPSDWTPIVLGMERATPDLSRHPRIRFSHRSHLRPRRFSQPLKSVYWRKHLVSRADVVHPTYYGLSEGLRYSDVSRPLVITVHDMIYAAYPKLEDDAAGVVEAQRVSVRHAAHIVCVSHYTEQDLLDRMPEAAGKTSVIHHASSFPVTPPPSADRIFAQPAFLYVGARGGYKNFEFLARAFARACSQRPNLKLRVAGSPPSREERWQLHLLGVGDKVEFVPYPDEVALRNLYQHSVALLYPSLHEGFGIPPLEAMS
jgi:glycosyltransferase involved in cell wall biosynthesis